MLEKATMSTDDDDDDRGELTIGLGWSETGPTSTWRSLFHFTSTSHTFSFVSALFFSIASGIIGPALALFLGRVFDQFSDYGSGQLQSKPFVEQVSTYAISLCGLGVASGMFNGAFYGCWLAFGELQACAAREQLFTSLLNKEVEWFDLRVTGIETMISRLQSQIKDLQYATSQPLGFMTQCLVTMVIALGVSFYHAWSMTLITLAAVPISTIVLAWISAWIQPLVDDHLRTLTMASKLVTVAISEIDAVKALNGQAYEVLRYCKCVKRAAKHFICQAHGNSIQIGFCRLVTLGMFVQGFWYGSHLVNQGKKSTGEIVTAFMSALIAAEAVEHVLPQLIVLEKGRAAGATLKLIQAQVERGRRIGTIVGTLKPPNVKGEIELRNISFSYPSTPGKLILDDISLSFAAGETTFITGKSGSGKSTIANILLGLYRPASGQVLVDGIPIQVLDIDWLRHSIGLCQQQSILFNESLRQNIAFGDIGSENVRKASLRGPLEFACLTHVVQDLPNGLETGVGIGGTTLSGGQKQRVALARTYLKNAPVLILDEATSALDHMTKFMVFESIRKWRRGKTTIIITHDVDQIFPDDYVYILEGGCLLQQGYQHELQNMPQNLPIPGDDSAFGFRAPDDSFPPISQDIDTRTTKISSESKEVKSRRKVSIIPSLFIAPGAISSQLPGLSGLISPISPKFASVDLGPMASNTTFNLQKQAPESMNIIDVIEMSNLKQSTHLKNELTTRAPDVPHVPRIHSHARTSSAVHRRLSTASTIVADITRRTGVLGLQKVEEASAILDILATVWPSLSVQHRVLLFLGFTSASMHSAAVPAFSWAFSRLLGTIIVVDRDKSSTEAQKWSVILLGITVIDAVAFYSMHYLLQICGQSWVDSIRVKAFKCILDQPRTWFDLEQNTVSRLTEKLDRSAEEMRSLLGRFAGFVYVAATMMIISIVWSMILSWKFTIVGLATTPAIYAVTRAFEIVSGRLERRSDEAAIKVSSVYHETFANFRTVLAFTLEQYFLGKCARATRNAFKVGMRRSLYAGFFFGLSDSAFLYVIALLLWFGAYLASTHPLAVENILSALTILLFGISNVNAAVAYIPQIGAAKTMANNLLRLTRLPSGVSHQHAGHARLKSIDQISFRNVSLTYPSRPAFPALTDLNLELHCDRTTALVGFSGSGKSSIASLIMGLYPSSSGSITIDQVPFRNIHPHSLRSLIAIVPQQPPLFPATVTENILYALPEGEGGSLSSLANAKRAAKLAGINDFIMTLPHGYNTLIGPGGAGLSGGQQQRIAIARAVARRPKFLILDEATSGLDDQTAHHIRSTIWGLQREGTGVLVITHQKKMMEICQDVVVMREGRVVEKGSFAELRSRKGGHLWELLGG